MSASGIRRSLSLEEGLAAFCLEEGSTTYEESKSAAEVVPPPLKLLEPIPPSFCMSELESEYALGFKSKVLGLMSGVAEDDPRLDYDFHDLEEKERTAWECYNLTHLAEIEDGIVGIGFTSGGLPYGHELKNACSIGNVPDHIIDDRMGGIVNRYLSKWVIFYSIDSVFSDSSYLSPSDLRRTKAQMTHMVKDDIRKEFPGVDPNLFDIYKRVSNIFQEQQKNLRLAGSRIDKSDHTNKSLAIGESLSRITEDMRSLRNAYVDQFLPEWKEFVQCKNELYHLRLIDYAIKAREELDTFVVELGETYVLTDQFFNLLQQEKGSGPLTPTCIELECLEMEELLKQARLDGKKELQDALIKWIGMIRINPSLGNEHPHLVEADLIRAIKQAPSVHTVESIAQFRELLEAKKQVYEKMRQALPEALLNQEENFIREVCRSKAQFTDCLQKADLRPHWFVEQEDRVIQVAHALSQNLDSIDDSQLESYVTNILKTWISELNRVHNKSGVEEGMAGWDSCLVDFEKTLMPKYVRECCMYLRSRAQLGEEAKVIEMSLEKMSRYYYGTWMRHLSNYQLIMSYKEMITRVYDQLPGIKENKTPFVEKSVHAITSGFSIGDIIATKIFNP